LWREERRKGRKEKGERHLPQSSLLFSAYTKYKKERERGRTTMLHHRLLVLKKGIAEINRERKKREGRRVTGAINF